LWRRKPDVRRAAKRGGRRKEADKTRKRVLGKGRPAGTATARVKRREIPVNCRIPLTAPPSEPAFIGKLLRLAAKMAFYLVSEFP
jgi:hypothetical protein